MTRANEPAQGAPSTPYTIVANPKNGSACYRAQVLTTRNGGRTTRPQRAWRGSLEQAQDEASRLNGLFLAYHTDVLFYAWAKLPTRQKGHI